jgi:hypothetical protein
LGEESFQTANISLVDFILIHILTPFLEISLYRLKILIRVRQCFHLSIQIHIHQRMKIRNHTTHRALKSLHTLLARADPTLRLRHSRLMLINKKVGIDDLILNLLNTSQDLIAPLAIVRRQAHELPHKARTVRRPFRFLLLSAGQGRLLLIQISLSL